MRVTEAVVGFVASVAILLPGAAARDLVPGGCVSEWDCGGNSPLDCLLGQWGYGCNPPTGDDPPVCVPGLKGHEGPIPWCPEDGLGEWLEDELADQQQDAENAKEVALDLAGWAASAAMAAASERLSSVALAVGSAHTTAAVAASHATGVLGQAASAPIQAAPSAPAAPTGPLVAQAVDLLPEEPAPQASGAVPSLPSVATDAPPARTPPQAVAYGPSAPEGAGRPGAGASLEPIGAVTPSAAPSHPAGTARALVQESGSARPPADPSSWEGAAPAVFHVAGALFALVPLILLLYHRLSRDSLLSSPRRQAILAYVRAHPASTAGEIAAAFSANYNAVLHHLRLLESFGLVARRKIGSSHRYFENHGRFTEDEKRLLSAIRPLAVSRVLRLLAQRPGLRQIEVRARLGLAKGTVSERIAALTASGLVARSGGQLSLTHLGVRALELAVPRQDDAP